MCEYSHNSLCEIQKLKTMGKKITMTFIARYLFNFQNYQNKSFK